MKKTTTLSDELITGTNRDPEKMTLFKPKVEKCTLEGIDEIQCLKIYPKTSIKMHGHNDQWEVWIDIANKNVAICPKGKQHMVSNCNDEILTLMAVKGHIDYSFSELAEFFQSFGFEVLHAGLFIKEESPRNRELLF